MVLGIKTTESSTPTCTPKPECEDADAKVTANRTDKIIKKEKICILKPMAVTVDRKVMQKEAEKNE
jgi:hypothetical protein